MQLEIDGYLRELQEELPFVYVSTRGTMSVASLAMRAQLAGARALVVVSNETDTRLVQQTPFPHTLSGAVSTAGSGGASAAAAAGTVAVNIPVFVAPHRCGMQLLDEICSREGGDRTATKITLTRRVAGPPQTFYGKPSPKWDNVDWTPLENARLVLARAKGESTAGVAGTDLRFAQTSSFGGPTSKGFGGPTSKPAGKLPARRRVLLGYADGKLGNSDEAAGAVVLVRGGQVSPGTKAWHCEQAGALAVLIIQPDLRDSTQPNMLRPGAFLRVAVRFRPGGAAVQSACDIWRPREQMRTDAVSGVVVGRRLSYCATYALAHWRMTNATNDVIFVAQVPTLPQRALVAMLDLTTSIFSPATTQPESPPENILYANTLSVLPTPIPRC
jgi:hypothetical protein